MCWTIHQNKYQTFLKRIFIYMCPRIILDHRLMVSKTHVCVFCKFVVPYSPAYTPASSNNIYLICPRHRAHIVGLRVPFGNMMHTNCKGIVQNYLCILLRCKQILYKQVITMVTDYYEFLTYYKETNIYSSCM
jgi:hypothetical protein